MNRSVAPSTRKVFDVLKQATDPLTVDQIAAEAGLLASEARNGVKTLQKKGCVQAVTHTRPAYYQHTGKLWPFSRRFQGNITPPEKTASMAAADLITGWMKSSDIQGFTIAEAADACKIKYEEAKNGVRELVIHGELVCLKRAGPRGTNLYQSPGVQEQAMPTVVDLPEQEQRVIDYYEKQSRRAERAVAIIMLLWAFLGGAAAGYVLRGIWG